MILIISPLVHFIRPPSPTIRHERVNSLNKLIIEKSNKNCASGKGKKRNG